MRVRTEAKREAILEIAAKAFMENGFERTSMAEISARVGGSKATLYGYFPSKEQLFVEVGLSMGGKHLRPVFAALSEDTGDVAVALQRFGERFLGFVSKPPALDIVRMVIAEAGRSDVGRLFYEVGPKWGCDNMAAYLKTAMSAGRLRPADAGIAARHLLSLMEAEIMQLRLMGMPIGSSRGGIRGMVERAVVVFMAAYGPVPGPA